MSYMTPDSAPKRVTNAEKRAARRAQWKSEKEAREYDRTHPAKPIEQMLTEQDWQDFLEGKR